MIVPQKLFIRHINLIEQADKCKSLIKQADKYKSLIEQVDKCTSLIVLNLINAAP